MAPILALLVSLTLPPQADPAKEGAELLQKVVERAKTAKSIRVSSSAELVGHPQGPRSMSVDLLLRGAGEFRAVMLQDAHLFRIKSDGSGILSSGRMQLDPATLKPADIMTWLRNRSAVAAFIALDFIEPRIHAGGLSTFEKATLEGEEKIGTVAARIVAYELPMGPGRSLSIRAWIDSERLTVLKREAKLGPMTMKETVRAMEFDAEIDGDEFAIQSKLELRRAQEGMVAKSVELYGRHSGKLPDRLDQLDGGFWIGGRKPADLAYKVSAGGATVGSRQVAKPAALRVSAPTERLEKLFAAQVRLRLLKAAIEAFEVAYWRQPAISADLIKKPAGIEVWPEGGFVSDESKLKDPWGEPVLFTFRKGAVVLRCAGDHTILEENLEREERRQLIERSVDVLPPEIARELPLGKLGDEDIAVREAAMKEILSHGPAALAIVEAHLGKDKPAVMISGLKAIRDRLNGLGYSWRTELRSLRAVAYGESPGRTSMNEKLARDNLAEFLRAQDYFRTNDPDGDSIPNYWVADVAGLFAKVGARTLAGPAGRLARADATPGRKDYPEFKELTEPEPFVGAYLIAAVRHFESGGKKERYDNGTGRHPERFGIVLFPEEYGESGFLTFLVDETGDKWSKDLGGAEIDTFPADPAGSGWTLVR